MPKPQADTPHVTTLDLITGHFRRRAGYRAWRGAGIADWLMIYTVQGRGRFGYGTGDNVAGEIVVEAGDIVLLRPGTLHDYGVEPTRRRWDLLWTHFHPKPAWHELLHWPAAVTGWPGLMRLRLDPPRRRLILRRFLEMHRLATGAYRRRIELAQNALEAVLLWCDAANPNGGATDGRIQQTLDAVCADLRHPPDLAMLAQMAALSHSRFAHLFCQTVGMPPRQWIESQQMNRARQLLQWTRLSIKEIAAEVGFDDPFYFSARFRKRLGKSPRTFRATTVTE